MTGRVQTHPTRAKALSRITGALAAGEARRGYLIHAASGGYRTVLDRLPMAALIWDDRVEEVRA